MKTILHTLLLGTAFALVASTQAQNQVFIMGQVLPCVGAAYDVHIQTGPGVQPALDTTVQTGPGCGYFLDFHPASTSGFLHISTSCDSGLTFLTDSAYFSFGFLNTDTVNVTLVCGGGSVDCNGVLNGPALPGTACDDGNPVTLNDTWNTNCICVGEPNFYDCNGVANGSALPGTPCFGINADSSEYFGVFTAACACVLDSTGNYVDCLGVLNGPNMPGTACDDGNILTINDTWNINCTCSGNVPSPCQAMYYVGQALDADSIPIPNDLWLSNTSGGGSGVYTYSWDFGDGFTSTENTPVHSYAGNGPYWLCLTINDGIGCTDTYCDSVSVDDSGFYSGLVGGSLSSGFMINVIDQTALGIPELPSTSGLTIWPNPVTDELNVALLSGITGVAIITVTDMNGRVVRSQDIGLVKGKDRLSIPMSELSDGLYVLRIGNASGYISQRFLKAH